MPTAVLFIQSLDEALAGRGLGFLSSLIDIALTFAVALIALALVKRIVRGMLRRSEKSLHATPASLLRAKRMQTAGTIVISLTRYVVFFIAIAVSVGELGLSGPMKSLLAAAGIGTVVIGIGAQSLVSDMVSGFYLLFEDQFAVGDYISTCDVTGTVEAFSLRTTTVRAYTGELHTISNGSIKTLTNFSRTDSLAIIDVPIAPDADSERAMELMGEEARAYAAEISDVATDEPAVLGAVSAEGGAVVLRATLRVKPLEHWGVQRELTRRVLARFAKEGIPLPYSRIAMLEKREGGDA